MKGSVASRENKAVCNGLSCAIHVRLRSRCADEATIDSVYDVCARGCCSSYHRPYPLLCIFEEQQSTGFRKQIFRATQVIIDKRAELNVINCLLMVSVESESEKSKVRFTAVSANIAAWKLTCVRLADAERVQSMFSAACVAINTRRDTDSDAASRHNAQRDRDSCDARTQIIAPIITAEKARSRTTSRKAAI